MSYVRLNETGELELDLKAIDASLVRDEETRGQEDNEQRHLESINDNIIVPSRVMTNSILNREVTPDINSQASKDALQKKAIIDAPLYDMTKPLKNQLLQYRGENYIKIMYSDVFHPIEIPYIVLYDDRINYATSKKLLIDILAVGTWHPMEVYYSRHPGLNITDDNVV